MINYIFFLLFAMGMSGCSLDDRYFSNRRASDAYQLAGTVIPAAQVSEVHFSSNGNTLYGEFVSATPATTKTILYIHGDDKDIDKFWERVGYLYPLNRNILIFDFQGYGKSSGTPSLSAIKQNTRDALSYLKSRNDVDVNKIIYYAFSLGGVFGLDLAAHTAMPAAMITENIAASSDALVSSSIRMGVPSSFLLNETFDSADDIQKLTIPLLMFHSLRDETIPYEANATVMFRDAPEPKTTYSIDATHSNLITTLGVEEYRRRLQEFFDRNNL